MTSTVIIDGLTVTFGDTDGDLTGSQHGRDQNLGFPAPDIYVGDANALLDRAVGGSDTLNGVIVVGDAFTLEDHARGGDDNLRAGSYTGAVGIGDAETMS